MYLHKLGSQLTLWLPGRGACQDPDILVYEFYFSSFEAGIANAISSFKWRKIHKCSIYLTKICVILWLRSLTNDDGNFEKYINVVYIWRKFVSFYGYVHWRMTTEISVMYGSEKVKDRNAWRFLWDINGQVTDLSMTSHLFGSVWCAASSTFAPRRRTTDFECG